MKKLTFITAMALFLAYGAGVAQVCAEPVNAQGTVSVKFRDTINGITPSEPVSVKFKDTINGIAPSEPVSVKFRDAIDGMFSSGPVSVQFSAPVGQWHMDNDWQDSSGNNLHGTAAGGASFAESGRVNQAGAFDGTDDYVDIGSSPLLRTPMRFSIEAWIRVASGSTQNMLIAGTLDETAKTGYGLTVEGSVLHLKIGDGSLSTSSTPGIITQGSWVHVAGTYDGFVTRLYINGELEKETQVTKALRHTAPFSIGHGNGTAYFNGDMDEVEVYPRALTSDEIWKHYAIGAGMDIIPPEPPMVNPVEPVTDLAEVVLSGTKEAQSSIVINGQTVLPVDASTVWETTYLLHSGLNILKVTSRDEAGNESNPPVAVEVSYDNTAPQITASLPADGARVNSLETIDLLVEDEYAEVDFETTMGSASVTASDGTGVAGTWQLVAGHMIFTPQSQLADGSYSVTLSPADTFGNTGSASIDFSLDTQLPEIQSLTIQPGSILKAGTATFTLVFSENVVTSQALTFTFGTAAPYDSHQVTGGWINQNTWRGTYAFTNLTGDGEYVLVASGAVDTAQNTMLSTEAGTFILDTVVPEKPLLDPIDSPVNTPEITVSGTKSPDTGIWINGKEAVPVDNATTWSATYLLTEGGNQLTVVARDRAGNESEQATASCTLDSKAPTIASSSPADGDSMTQLTEVDILLADAITGVDLTASMAGSEVKAGDTAVAGSWRVESGHLIFSPDAAFTDGTYTVSLQAVDNIGNTGTVAVNFSLDNTPSTVENFTMNPGSPHRAEQVSFTVTFNEDMLTGVEPSVTFGMGEAYPAYSVGNGSWLGSKTWKGTYTFLDSMGDGTYYVHVSNAKDKAGNTIIPAQVGSFVLDTIAPADPSINAVESPTRATQVVISGQKPGDSYCYMNGTLTGALYTETQWEHTLSLNEGLNTISVHCQDEAGNQSGTATASITLDSRAPKLVSSVPAQDSSVTSLAAIDVLLVDDTTEIDFATTASGAEVVRNGTPVNGTWSIVDGHMVFTPGAPAEEGTYTVQIYATDILGNKSTAIFSFAVDISSPSVETLVMSPDSPHKAEHVTFTITFSEDMETAVQPDVSLRKGLFTSYSLTGSWISKRNWRGSFDFTQDTGDGTYTVKASAAKDSAGNEMANADIGSFVLDTSAPEAPGINAVQTPTNIPNQAIAGTKPSGTAVVINGIQRVPFDETTQWTYTYPLSEGLNIISVKARDAAGNDSAEASATVVLDTTPPAFSIDDYQKVANASTQTVSGSKEPGAVVLLNGAQIFGADDTSASWSYTVSLVEGIPNKFTFSASDALGNTRTQTIEIVFDASAPPPLGEGVLVGDGSGSGTEVTLSWSAYPEPSDTAYYRVYMSDSDFLDTEGMTPVATIDKGITTYRKGSLTEGNTYYFAVVPVDMGGNYTSAVNTAEGVPEDTVAPEDVKMVSVTAGYSQADGNWITVQWSPSADSAGDLDDQMLYFDDGTGYDGGTSLGKLAVEHTRKGLVDATAYKFKVTTKDTKGHESKGAVALGVTRLENPASVTPVPGNAKVSLSWTPVDSGYLKQYNIYRLASDVQQTDVNNMVLVDSVSSTSYIDMDLTNDTTYQYAVTALNVFAAENEEVQSQGALTRMDETGPEITEVSVNDGEVISAPLVVTASAADAESSMDRVELYVDGALVADSTGESVSYFWNVISMEDGNHAISVIAYDQYGNATEVARQVIVSLAPPDAPSISGYVVNQTAPEYLVTLAGTTSLDTSVVLWANGAVVSTVQEADGAFSFSGVKLNEGDNILMVKALHRGGESAYSPEYKIVVDMGAPPAPSGLSVQVLSGGYVRFSWMNGQGELPAGYNLYMSSNEFSSKDEQGVSKANDSLVKYTFSEFLPPDDTMKYYAVTALDSSGNESDISNLVSATSDRVAPSEQSIVYTYHALDGTSSDTATVAGPGSIDVSLTVSEPLRETPFLSFEPLSGSPIIVGLTRTDSTHYEGSFEVNAQSPHGPLTYKFSGKDLAGNRGNTQGSAITLDVSGPVASMVSPLQVQQIVTEPVEVKFTLDEEPAGVPKVQLKGSDGTIAEVTGLTSADNLFWSGVMDLSGMPEGDAEFVLAESWDGLGNLGTTVAEGKTLLLYMDTVPPPAVPSGLTAKSDKGGVIALSWNTMNGVDSFNLWRRAEGESVPGKVMTGLADTSVTDIPPADGTYYYSVSAVGLLESESALSEEAMAMSDRFGPAAPQNLSLSLDGTGVVATWDAVNDESVYGYHLYRVDAPVTTVEGLTPIAKVLTPLAVDTAPRKTSRFYAVAAVDSLKNVGPPSECLEIEFPVPPVRSLVLEKIDQGAPTITWQKPDGSIAGYHIYRNAKRITPQPVQVLTYTDGYYAGGTITYGISAVDILGNESPIRDVTLPTVDVGLASGTSLRRGLLETIRLEVTSGHVEPLNLASLSLKVGEGGTSILPGPFTIEPGASIQIEKVATTTSDAFGTVPILTTLNLAPEPGTAVRLSRTLAADVLGASTAVEIFNDPLARNTDGKVRLKINNLGSAQMEVLTSENNGPTGKVKVYLKDQDGNVLSTGYLNQRSGSVVNMGSYSVARIEPGGSFLSEPVLLSIPQSAPFAVVIEVVIENTYYHYGKTDQVTAPGIVQSVDTTITETAYRAFAAPEKEFYPAPEPVLIQGQAIDNNTGEPVPFVPVRLGISVSGFDRFYTLVTGEDGTFSYTFNPGSNEAGLYNVWAVHPDVNARDIQSSFAIAGFRIKPSYYTLKLAKGHSFDIPVTLSNLGGAPLTELQFEINSSDGISAVVVNTGDDVLVPSEKAGIKLRVTASDTAPETGYVAMRAFVSEGVEVTLNTAVIVCTPIPVISTSPSYIDTGMVRGTQKLVSFTIKNTGDEVLRNPRLEGLSTPWMSLMSSGTLGDIGPGESRIVGIVLSPSEALTQGVYDDHLVIYSDNHIPYTYHVQVTVSSDATGNAAFDVLNELFEDVAGASIFYQHSILTEFRQSVTTGADGTAMVYDMPEGRYLINVTAPGHKSYSGSFMVYPGLTTTVPVALEVTLVDIEWSVVPIIIEDRYEIQITQTFQTNVPTSVLVVDPPGMNVPALAPGEVFNAEFTITNQGLIAVDFKGTNFPSSYLDYDIEVFANMPDRLEAMQKVTVPYRITRRAQ